MAQKITLNDGTELDNSSVAESDNILWVYVYGAVGFADLFTLLNDPEKTKKIVALFGETSKTYRGFDELFCIRKENGTLISAGLRK